MSDDILLDEWNDAFLDQLIRTQEEFVLTSRSSAPKPPPPPPPPTSAVNFFSPPRELSQRPPTSIIVDSPSPTPNQSSDNKDLEIDRLKRELEQSIKQFANLKKEHVKLKKERDNIEDQLKSISSRNEEENASSKSKSSDTVPKQVIVSLERLQRRFLWGGNSEQKKIPWVRWESMCLSKEKGGLGIKKLDIFVCRLHIE